MGYVLWAAALTGNMLGFITGTTQSWTSSQLSKLQSSLNTVYSNDSLELAWVSALMPFGSIFGPFLYGYLVNAIGRKYTILCALASFLPCYLLFAFGKSIALFMLGRFVTGLSVGGTFTVLPMYLSEVSEDFNRGAIGTSMNCLVCLGLLFSYAVGPYTSLLVFNIILAIFPVVCGVLFFTIAPESPHYLVSKHKMQEAEAALKKIRNEDVKKELALIEEKIKNEEHSTIKDLFSSNGNVKALTISIGLIIFQQLSGIVAVLFFAQKIFEAAEPDLPPEICSIIIGLTQFATSFVSPLLSDKLGRKILLLFSAVGMLISEIPLGLFFFFKENGMDVTNIGFLPIVCLVTYLLAYNSGYGPLPWTITSELFPSKLKPIAAAAAALVCSVFAFFITFFFQSIVSAIGQGPVFWIFSAFCAMAVPFSWLFVIETKGKSSAEIKVILNC